MTLRKKLVLSFIILVFLLGIGIGFFSYQDTKELVLKSKENEMSDTINRIDISMNSWVHQVMTLSDNIKKNPMVHQRMTNGVNEQKNKISSDDGNENYLHEWMDNLAQMVEVCSDILLINTEGEICYSYSENQGDDAEEDNRIQEINEERLEQCIALGQKQSGAEIWLGMGKPIICSREEQIVSLVSSVVFGDMTGGEGTEEQVGYMVIELNPKQFSALMLNNHSMFQNQYTFIMDETHEIICSNKNIRYEWMDKMTEQMDTGTRRYKFDWEGETYFACKQYNGLTGWEIYSVVSEDDFFPQAIHLRQDISVVVMIAMVAAVLCVSILSFTFTKPVQMLSKAMKRVESGDFEVQIDTEKRDEMGNLIRTFNYMVREIHNLVNVVYQQKLAQKNAELAALQAQINPHFLYNTLDSINWMLIERDEMEISDVIVSLGDILKYSLHGHVNLVAFREELHYIKSYLCIQKNRLENRLLVEMDVADEVLDCQVPKLILQPIVENAILHGIEKTKEGGTISITAVLKESKVNCVQEPELYITVNDNGKGMSEEELKFCKKRINFEKTEESQGKSIGMHNVHRRIQLLFGEKYGIQIASEKGKGTTVTIILPQKPILEMDKKEAGTSENINC